MIDGLKEIRDDQALGIVRISLETLIRTYDCNYGQGFIHDSREMYERLQDRQERTIYCGSSTEENSEILSFIETSHRAKEFAKYLATDYFENDGQVIVEDPQGGIGIRSGP